MKKYFVFLFFSLGFMGCIPEEKISPPDPVADNLLEIMAPAGFDWTTTQKVDVKLEKLFIPISLVRAIELKDESGTILFKGSHDLSTDFTLTVTLPNHVQSLILTAGDVVLKEPVSDKKCLFSFPEIEVSTSED